MATSNNTLNGCNFTGPGPPGTCTLQGADGLPVELLDFAIDEEEEPDTATEHKTE